MGVSVCQTVAGVAVDTDIAASDRIPYGSFEAGEIHVPSGSSLTSLTWHSSHDGTTYVAAQDAAGSPVAQTVAAGKAYPMPAALAGCKWLKAVGNADGTVHLTLKG